MLRRFMSGTGASITEALKTQNVGQALNVQGWVKAIRRQKVNTFIDLDDGLSLGKLQIICDSSKIPPDGIDYPAAIADCSSRNIAIK